MSLPYGRRTSSTGAGPPSARTHTSVASRTPSRIGTIMSFSTLKLIGAPPSQSPPPILRSRANSGQGARTVFLVLAGSRLSATTSAQYGVGDVRGIGRRVDARLNDVQLDGEVVSEQPVEVLRTDVVRRVDAARLHVLAVLVVEVVVDGEQQSARAHRIEQRPHGSVARGLGQRRVLHRHKAERTGREHRLQDVPADPVNPGASPFGCLPRPADRHIGDVDGGNRPATASQPDRVGTLAAADVKGLARGEAGDFGDKPPIRAPAPYRLIVLVVSRVPLGGVPRRAGPLLVVFVFWHAPQSSRHTPGRSVSPVCWAAGC